MSHYDHINFPDDLPRYGGSYVTNTGTAFESWNFHLYPDGKYYGFVETKYTGETAVEENAKQLHIEKIDNQAVGESVDGVTVVFCAHSDIEKTTVIVGWYKNATVLRGRRKCMDGHSFNIMAKEAVLLPETLRKGIVPRARQRGFGFGQSNVWYAKDEVAQQFVSDTLSYIEKFKTGEDVWNAAVDNASRCSDEELIRKVADHNDEGTPVYTSTVTLRKRTPARVVLIKRRANGVCQLCGKKAPFEDKNGRPYLEAHHIVPLADNGPDALSNMVALCPNCHRKMHIVGTKEDVEKLKKAAQADGN